MSIVRNFEVSRVNQSDAIRGDVNEKRPAVFSPRTMVAHEMVPSRNALKRRNGRLRRSSLCRGAPTTTAMRHKLQLAPSYLRRAREGKICARADVAPRYVCWRAASLHLAAVYHQSKKSGRLQCGSLAQVLSNEGGIQVYREDT